MSKETAVDVSKRVDEATDPSHPIPVGETVAILKISPSTGVSIEGHAVVTGVARGPNRYRVCFESDLVARERTVHPDYQHAPGRMLEIMRDIWRASEEAAIDEFFPDAN